MQNPAMPNATPTVVTSLASLTRTVPGRQALVPKRPVGEFRVLCGLDAASVPTWTVLHSADNGKTAAAVAAAIDEAHLLALIGNAPKADGRPGGIAAIKARLAKLRAGGNFLIEESQRIPSELGAIYESKLVGLEHTLDATEFFQDPAIAAAAVKQGVSYEVAAAFYNAVQTARYGPRRSA